jgi:hypothetical protein
VGLCRGNCVMYRMALGLRASRLSQGFQLSYERLTADRQQGETIKIKATCELL